uniref:Uncharacterized protein n=1 Tax=Trepomonas sp. PC1 TaxID=1076344 RepID=A0A146K277_9EUKA|eukprot:JAP89974.1 Hypothetical protein TPC1_30531 [Trepomonas sp. PC1]
MLASSSKAVDQKQLSVMKKQVQSKLQQIDEEAERFHQLNVYNLIYFKNQNDFNQKQTSILNKFDALQKQLKVQNQLMRLFIMSEDFISTQDFSETFHKMIDTMDILPQNIKIDHVEEIAFKSKWNKQGIFGVDVISSSQHNHHKNAFQQQREYCWSMSNFSILSFDFQEQAFYEVSFAKETRDDVDQEFFATPAAFEFQQGGIQQNILLQQQRGQIDTVQDALLRPDIPLKEKNSYWLKYIKPCIQKMKDSKFKSDFLQLFDFYQQHPLLVIHQQLQQFLTEALEFKPGTVQIGKLTPESENLFYRKAIVDMTVHIKRQVNLILQMRWNQIELQRQKHPNLKHTLEEVFYKLKNIVSLDIELAQSPEQVYFQIVNFRQNAEQFLNKQIESVEKLMDAQKQTFATQKQKIEALEQIRELQKNMDMESEKPLELQINELQKLKNKLNEVVKGVEIQLDGLSKNLEKKEFQRQEMMEQQLDGLQRQVNGLYDQNTVILSMLQKVAGRLK